MVSWLGKKRGKKCGSKKERKRLQIKRKQTGAGKKEQMAKKDSKAKNASLISERSGICGGGTT